MLSLALAIGANSAIFSFADALLLRPLPVKNPAGLLDVSSATADDPLEGMSFPDYRDLREKSRSFSDLAAYRLTSPAVATNPAAPAQIRFANLVSDNFFSDHGRDACSRPRVSALTKRLHPAQPVAMISYEFWQQNYAGDVSVLGSSLRLNGIVFTIVGVTPESFTGLDRFIRPSIFVPLAMAQRLGGAPSDPLEDRGRHDLVVKGRLSAGASQESAQAELATIGAAFEREYVKTNRNRHMAVRTELKRRILQSPQLLALAKMLMGLVALILIIACSNVANLLLARARARSREIAIRLSIGAGRGRVVRQLMTESLIVAIAGGAAGIVGGLRRYSAAQTLSVPSDPPNVLGVQLDWRVVEFSLLAALGSCIFFGLAPAWQTARTDFVSALKAGGDGVSGKRAHVRPRCSGGRPDRARDGGADRRRHVSRGLPEHAGDAARISHGPPDQPGYRARRAALLARTDQGLLPPAGGSRSRHGRSGGGGDDRVAAACPPLRPRSL